MSLLLILTGMSLGEIGHLDILTFNALLDSVIRVNYTQKTEDAWTNMIASQGTQKSMKDWVKGWQKLVSKGKQKKNDITKFLSDFGKGF